MTSDRDEFDRGYLTAQVDALTKAVEEIRRDVKSLVAWRAWVMGAAATVAGIVSAAFAWLRPNG
jgi:hypothetical protein